MLFSFFTQWMINRKLKRNTEWKFRSFEQTQRLVLLAQEPDIPSIIPVIPELTQGGIKITLVVEGRKGNVPTAIPGCYPILPLQTYWLLQCPSYDFLAGFNNNDGDVLLDLSTTPSLALNYLALHSRAEFKIGIPKNEKNPFGLQILYPQEEIPEPTDDDEEPAAKTPPPTAGELLRHALFYWKKIGANENNP